MIHRALLLALVGWLLAGVVLLTVYRANQVDAPRASMHSNDFKHLWIGARLIHLGESPYDESHLFDMAASHRLGGINPYVYLPFTGLVMTPVTQRSFPEAVRRWFWISHAAIVLAIALAAVHVTWGARLWAAGFLAALGLLFAAEMMPLTRQFTAGQLNCVLAFVLVVILISVERRWLWLAGGAIAFATLFKLSPGIFLLWILWKRAWRLLTWTGVWLAVFLAWSLLQVGLRVHLEFWPLLREMRIGHSTWAHHGMAYHVDAFNQSMGAFLLHAFAGEGGTQAWLNLGPAIANALTVLFALGVLACLIFVTRRGWERDGLPAETWRAEWAMLVCASLLIPSLLWDHYAVQLLPVLVVGLWSVLTRPPPSLSMRIAAAVLWAAAVFLLTVPVPHGAESLRSGLGLVVMSARLWGVLLVFGLVFGLCLWSQRRCLCHEAPTASPPEEPTNATDAPRHA